LLRRHSRTLAQPTAVTPRAAHIFGSVRDPRPFLFSFFFFVAWIVAATGWVRFLAVVWLVYPAYAVVRMHRRRATVNPGLDALDAEQRQERRDRVREWSSLRDAEIARAKRILKDPQATDEQKHDAKILIGTYAIDPVLMAASGWDSTPSSYANKGTAAPGNRHPTVPSPPTNRLTLLQKLRRLLRHSR
jgi:hypothetical protein